MSKMKPFKNLLRTASVLALLTLTPGWLSANETTHEIREIFGNMKHALGWDTLNLKTVEKDAAGHPVLERTANAANSIERTKKYYPNGKRKSQTVTVTSKDSGKVLTEETKDWASDGRLEHRFIQDNDYNKQGSQVKGEIHIKDYSSGRLVREIKKRFQQDHGDWEMIFEAKMSYYDDGDLRERLREEPLKGLKARELWSEREGKLGRKKTSQKWDGATKAWQ